MATLFVIGMFAILLGSVQPSGGGAQHTSATSVLSETHAKGKEDAYRANNLGVALLEQFKYADAVREFQRALQIDPKLLMAHINLAIALFNVPDLDAASREAQTAAMLAPQAPQPHYLLGLIARAQNRTDEALAAFARVRQIDPRDTSTNINIGQLLVQQKQYDKAVEAFRAALDVEPYNTTALYSLANALTRTGKRNEAERLLQRFQKLRRGGAGTQLGKDYPEQGRYSEAIVSTGAEPELVSHVTPNITFMDATASAFSFPANSSAPASAPSSASIFGRFRPLDTSAANFAATAKHDIAATLGGSLVLFDYDGDGRLDLFETNAAGDHLYHNVGGKFVDVTTESGLANQATVPHGIGTAVVAGDYDNDGKPDLFIIRSTGLTLYHNDGNGRFSDRTASAKIPSYQYLSLSAAFVDADHDGDLDIFIAGFVDFSKRPQASSNGKSSGLVTFPDDFAGAPNMLLRNNGNGTFTDITAQAKVAGSHDHAVAVVPTDFDNHRDIDLLIVNYSAAPDLFKNLRDGSFSNVARETGLNINGRFICVAAGDVNKDGFTDFFFGRADGAGVWAMSDGKEHFNIASAPAGTAQASAAQFFDYDNDGLLDLVAVANGRLRVWRNLGADNWTETTDRAVAGELSISAGARTTNKANGAGELGGALAGRIFMAGDVDGDGDTDIILRSAGAAGTLRFARNDGGNRNHSVRVNLAGKVSNRSGVQTKIEMRAGSLWQKLETYAASPAPAPADIIFGLGARDAPDAVRVVWPSGTVQSETEMTGVETATTTTVGDKSDRAQRSAAKTSPLALTITELDRKPSSCPYLFTWNGERFEFVTDFMGGGEMGDWIAPGKFNTPDPEEYVRIRSDQLKPRAGRYEIRVTNELEEVAYVDRLQLISIAHPQDVAVYPNEGLIDPPRPFKIFATRNAHPPVSATDDHGHDVLERIAYLDHRYVDDFALDSIRGFAVEHALTLDLGKVPDARRTLLLLTGYTDYAYSSDAVSAAQSGKSMAAPRVQVKDEGGRWHTVIRNIGIPVGKPQTLVVDLTKKFLSANHEVRLVTNMRIYWDQILVDTSGGEFPLQITRLALLAANLRWRGFSQESAINGRNSSSYDYTRVSYLSSWKIMPGRYTREGDVRQLLNRVDDMFVVARPGDEISLSFDANRLPALPQRWTRTFLLYVNGFSKEMDINSASPDEVAPLPFHAMKRYPYTVPESYPMTRAHRAYLEHYNTRVVRAPAPQLATTFDEAMKVIETNENETRNK